MSTYEIRIDGTRFHAEGNLDEMQVFSIGHETCAAKFLQVTHQKRLLDYLKVQERSGKEIRIVTPFIPQTYWDAVKERLQALFQQECFVDSVVVVNDLGLMSYIHKEDPGRRICLGRSLLFSFDYTPWGTDIYCSESKAVQTVVRQVNFWDDEKLSFFRSYHVTEVEANLTANTRESLKKVQKAGFKVNVHKGTFLYGTQRSCFVKRFSENPATCCETECERLECLELSELWEAAGFHSKMDGMPFPEPLFLRGNQILGAARTALCEGFDNIILDSAYFS